MARPSSKIMTLADKKAATADVKAKLKDNAEARKSSEAAVAAANKALAAAKKENDKLVTAAKKLVAAAEKEGAKLVAAAQKDVDAATKKHTKIFDATNAGDVKLNDRLSAINNSEVQKGKPGPKAKTEAAAA